MSRLFDDASSEYLNVASAPVAVVPFSMACWFYSDTITIVQVLMSIGVEGSDNRHILRLRGDTAGDPVQATSTVSSDANANTTTGYSANTWHHACGVWASTTSRKAYIDGGSSAENTTSRVLTCNKLLIGARPSSTTPGQYMSGSIAEAAIWDVALTDAEVALLAKGYSPLFVRPESLVFYIPLVRDNDKDIIGGLALTANNTPSISVHPRIINPIRPMIITAPVVAGGGGLSIPIAMNQYRQRWA